MTPPAPPSIGLEEARRRLKELGYLNGRVERFVFRRALEGRGGLLLPAVFAGALAAALACAAAVETAEPEFGRSPGPFAVLLAHFFAASLLPAALCAGVLALAADRVRRPAGAGIAAGLLAGGAVLALWIGGSYALGGGFLHALVWGVPVSAAALLSAESARSGFLARAYAHSRRLPERPRRGVFLAVTAAGLALAAVLLALRPEQQPVRPPQPRGAADMVRVVAVDGLEFDGEASRTSPGLKELFEDGGVGWWPALKASPPEIWMDLATGALGQRHGVRALERVRPLGSSLSLRPPPGMSWYLRGIGRRLGLVQSAPVSAGDRRSLAFWEVCSSAGLSSISVGWWSSGPWPGAAVVGNEDILERARSGGDVDRVALEEFSRLQEKWGGSLQTVYLPSLDIVRSDGTARKAALDRLEPFLRDQIERAAGGAFALIILAADSHPPEGGLGRMVVFGRGAVRRSRLSIRPEDVAPTILARAGIPVAEDLPGRPVSGLFPGDLLETTTVASYGPRIRTASQGRVVTDKEYLEKLRSLGYLK